MGEVSEAARFYQFGEITEIKSGPARIMRIGAETYYLTSQFHVAQENVPVQFRSSAMQFLIGFRIDFQCLAVLDQIT